MRIIGNTLISLGLVATGGQVLAASSAASTVLNTASASVGSVSTSSNASSDSSQGPRLAAGHYRIAAIQASGRQPDAFEVTLARTDVSEPAPLILTLPQATVRTALLADGQEIVSRARPYGFELARADRQEPFFLVLLDHWHQDLRLTPVGL